MNMRFLFLTLLLGVFVNANAQQNTIGWTDYYEDNLVLIQVQQQTCQDLINDFQLTYHFIRLENKSNQAVEVSFDKMVDSSVDLAIEKAVEMVLQPNEVVAASCENPNNSLRIAIRSTAGKPSKDILSEIEVETR